MNDTHVTPVNEGDKTVFAFSHFSESNIRKSGSQNRKFLSPLREKIPLARAKGPACKTSLKVEMAS